LSLGNDERTESTPKGEPILDLSRKNPMLDAMGRGNEPTPHNIAKED
jgi:hypothetical protein